MAISTPTVHLGQTPYDPVKKRVFQARDVIFNEQKCGFEESSQVEKEPEPPVLFEFSDEPTEAVETPVRSDEPTEAVETPRVRPWHTCTHTHTHTHTHVTTKGGYRSSWKHPAPHVQSDRRSLLPHYPQLPAKPGWRAFRGAHDAQRPHTYHIHIHIHIHTYVACMYTCVHMDMFF